VSPTFVDLRESGQMLREEARVDRLAHRLLDATMTCLARTGLAKTTIDDVAREAGCSRATVYRHFPSRVALVLAAVDAEIDALVAAIQDAADGAATLEDALSAMFVTAGSLLREHAALQRALELEPEIVLPALSFEGGDRLLAEASARFAPTLARFVPPDRATRAAEWCTRVLLAYLHPDRAPIVVTDEAAARALVRRHVVPALSPRPITAR
jgi:AcrR family transcriptional regulator